jgi:hypothetical protein
MIEDLRKRLTTEEFIAKSRSIHGDRYDYSKVKYLNRLTPVIIICPKHGDFLSSPANHYLAKDCPQCHIDKHTKKQEQFLKEAKEIHGYKYDYSEVEYIKNCIPVIINCPIHGYFNKRPAAHVAKREGCPDCVGRIRWTTEKFIKSILNILQILK